MAGKWCAVTLVLAVMVSGSQTWANDLWNASLSDANYAISDAGTSGDTAGCTDNCGKASCGTCTGSGWNAGFEFVFAKPHFDDNHAYTVTESDGSSFDTITQHDFDHDFELSPRVWVDYQTGQQVGLRAGYWQFDDSPAALQTNAPANGFGLIDHPTFGTVDITTAIPAESFTAQSDLNVYALDLEITKSTQFCNWGLLAAAGLRYGSVDQNYLAQLRNASGNLAGQIDFDHTVKGIGPTLAIEARRPSCNGRLSFFGTARASLLFGDATSRLSAGEDLDLGSPFTTTRIADRDETIPVGELRLGFDWNATESPLGRIFVRSALEGQWWGSVGSAASEDGDLGFLGLVVGVGLER